MPIISKDFVPAMITNGAAACDLAMVIIDASVGKFEAGFSKGGQTREHIFLTRGLGCSRLIGILRTFHVNRT